MKKYIFAFFACMLAAAIAVAAGAFGRSARAQSGGAEILLSWQAATYVPPGFSGKALPTAGATITAGVDLFVQGKRVSLSGRQVNWFVDEEFYRGAPGLARISLEAPNSIGGTVMQIRVVLPDYGSLAKTIRIPVVPPEVSISSSAPDLYASDAPFALSATPYFFNVENLLGLQFSWSLNGGVVATGNPFVVTRQMADSARGPARLEVNVRNPARPIERIKEQLILFPQ